MIWTLLSDEVWNKTAIDRTLAWRIEYKLHLAVGNAGNHWMRHTHATPALQRGVELTTVRDNLHHASLATNSIYLHTDEARRARQLGDAFGKVRG